MDTIGKLSLAAALSFAGRAAAQTPPPAHAHAAGDSAFHAMQERGRLVMGVDQYTSIHHFDKLRDGGRVELQRDVDDSAGTAIIRAHLRAIQHAFEAGDFSMPAVVHMRDVPGAKVMAERRSRIRYSVRDLPRGGELRIHTTDTRALAAVHRFIDFQRRDHRATGSG